VADATLKINADTRQADKALGRVTAALGALASALATKAIVQQYTAFEKYRTVLNTYLGSQSKANRELGRLQDLANSLPQDLNDITKAFVLFTSRGIDTTNKSLTAFSNIATANGKSLEQLGEAVADALTGEYERLKEFGIKVSKDNDKFVADIGKGNKIIADSSRELVDELRKLGEENGKFGRAASVNAATLSQSFSNLQGAVFEANVAFGESAKGGLKTLVETITFIIRQNKTFIEQLGRGLGQAASAAANVIALVVDNIDKLRAVAVAFVAIKLQMVVYHIGTSLYRMGKMAAAAGTGMLRLNKAAVGKGVVGLIGLGIAIADAMGALDGLYAKLGVGESEFDKLSGSLVTSVNRINGELQKLDAASERNTQAWQDLVKEGTPLVAALNELTKGYDEQISAINAQLTATNLSATEYANLNDELNSLRQNQDSVNDAIGEFTDISTLQLTITKKLTAAQKAANDALVDTNDAIEKNKEVGLAIQGVAELYQQQQLSFEQYSMTMSSLMDKQFAHQVKLQDAEDRHLNLIIKKYDREQSLIARNQKLKEIAYAKELKALGVNAQDAQDLARKRNEYEEKSEYDKTQYVIGQAGEALSKLGQYNKKAFEAAKALNIAEALMSTYTGVANALKLPFPLNLIIGGVVLASGLAQVAAIRSQQYSGRALGGPVMGGQSYIVGENGPEMFTPATSGGITRNNDLEPATTNVNFYIQANDTKGFDQLLAERKPMIVNMIKTAQNDRGNRSNV